MDTTSTVHKPLDPDSKPKIFSFPNGSSKKHTFLKNHNPSSNPPSLYRECLKNHAASLGGHALDGCGEFMPVPGSNPTDPTSLKCAACGCHRNFHRRIPDPPPDELDRQDDDMATDRHASDDDVSEDDISEDRTDRSSPPVTYFPSAPQMLLALRTGTGEQHMQVPAPVRSVVPVSGFGSGMVTPTPRKRFRTKFSTEQKQRMHELSEKLGWRLQKRDEALVEQWCREIGVGKGVFKVWMHNNKHVFLGTGKRGESREREGGAGIGAGTGTGMGVGTGTEGEGGTGGIGHVINGSGGGIGGGASSS